MANGAGDPGAVSQFGKEADETIYMVEEIKKTLSAYAPVSYTHLDVYKRQAYRVTGKRAEVKREGSGTYQGLRRKR